MILYVTYNDQPSGVYWSQVTDVVDHLGTLGKERVQLVALVSLRGYFRSRMAIRKRHPGALVLPMVPRAHNWRVNWIWLWLLCRYHRPSGIIGRGIFATALGLRMRDRGLVDQVCFDARAAYGAEWQEYRVVDNDRLIAECVELEREVVARADLRMAVSHALVQHWKDTMDYQAQRHLVIPCTLGRSVEHWPQQPAASLRAELHWAPEDTVLVYSGTSVGWQSLELAEQVVRPWLAMDHAHRMLFLSPDHVVIDRLRTAFPGQVARRWVPHQRVRSLLQECDIGLLLREARITNRVASPTKFAEYLSAGLAVAISADVGDFSSMVRERKLGQVVDGDQGLQLTKPDSAARERLASMAREQFTKESYDAQYRTILGCLVDEPVVVSPSPFAAPCLLYTSGMRCFGNTGAGGCIGRACVAASRSPSTPSGRAYPSRTAAPSSCIRMHGSVRTAASMSMSLSAHGRGRRRSRSRASATIATSVPVPRSSAMWCLVTIWWWERMRW